MSQWWIGHTLILVFTLTQSNGKSIVPDFLNLCYINDTKCVVDVWQNALEHLVPGRPDLNVPQLDPLKIEHLEVDIPYMANIKFNGTVKGFKGCIFESAATRFKKGHVAEALGVNCNITIKGHYNFTLNSTVLLGSGNEGLLRADGKGKVRLEKLKLKLLMDLILIRDEDNEIKLVLKKGPIGYKHKIGGPVVFAGNNIFLADEDISAFVIAFVNQNWQFVMNLFGPFFFEKAMEIVGDIVRGFFDVVPPKAFFMDDLKQFL